MNEVAKEEIVMSGAIAELRRKAQDAEERASRLQRMVELAEALGDEGLSELVALIASDEPARSVNGNGNGHDEDAERVPRGREAVRRIVAGRPGIWTMADLRAELKQRGWFRSNKSLDVAVSRLCDSNGEARRIGRGRYVFPANHGEEAAIESDASGGAMIPFET